MHTQFDILWTFVFGDWSYVIDLMSTTRNVSHQYTLPRTSADPTLPANRAICKAKSPLVALHNVEWGRYFPVLLMVCPQVTKTLVFNKWPAKDSNIGSTYTCAHRKITSSSTELQDQGNKEFHSALSPQYIWHRTWLCRLGIPLTGNDTTGVGLIKPVRCVWIHAKWKILHFINEKINFSSRLSISAMSTEILFSLHSWVNERQ